MKRFVLALLVPLMLAAGFSSSALAAIEVEGDAYVGYYDKYLWRGFDLSGSEGVVQGGVDLSAKGFTLSYWSNIQAVDDDAEGFDSGEATETDIVLDYSFDASELVSVSVGNIYYGLDGLTDTNELYLGIGLNTVLSPSFTVYYDYDEAESDALFFSASVGHDIEISDDLSVSLGALVSYNQASDYAVGGYRDWHNYELSLGVDYAVTDAVSISPSFMYSSPISDDAKLAIESETLTGVTVTLAF